MNKIALVDDHILLRQGLASLVNSFAGYQVLFEADNGRDMTVKLKAEALPAAILLDINMPVMDGFATASWLKENFPGIKVLALSMSDEEDTIIRMLQSGAHGYILKNTTPAELKEALDTIIAKGYYINDLVGANMMSSLSRSTQKEVPFALGQLTEKEIQFITLSCTDLNYNEIADKMAISPKTIDFYKANVEKKTGIKNRVKLVLFALKHGIVKL